MTAAHTQNALPSATRPRLDVNIPQTHNTAPVFEYRCLWTHDLRRKAKRWQDGFVKFHTFNKRVMVYDDLRNYIGDRHNQGGSDTGPEEGDEITLERGQAIVQVQERLGTADTDLSELLSKRNPKALEREQSAVQSRAISAATLVPKIPSQPLQRPRTKEKRHERRTEEQPMLPGISPYEQRQRNLQAESRRPLKKPRLDNDEHVPLREILNRARPAPAHTTLLPHNTTAPPKPAPRTQTAKIPLSPSASSAKAGSTISQRRDQGISLKVDQAVAQELRSNQMMDGSRQSTTVSIEMDASIIRSSPPVSTSNHLRSAPRALERPDALMPCPSLSSDEQSSPIVPGPADAANDVHPVKVLQLGSRNTRKGKLLCQPAQISLLWPLHSTARLPDATAETGAARISDCLEEDLEMRKARRSQDESEAKRVRRPDLPDPPASASDSNNRDAPLSAVLPLLPSPPHSAITTTEPLRRVEPRAPETEAGREPAPLEATPVASAPAKDILRREQPPPRPSPPAVPALTPSPVPRRAPALQQPNALSRDRPPTHSADPERDADPAEEADDKNDDANQDRPDDGIETTGPWSAEAFDLLGWYPPTRHKVKHSSAAGSGCSLGGSGRGGRRGDGHSSGHGGLGGQRGKQASPQGWARYL